MRAPDFVSPVVGCRVWQWDVAGLKSLNGVEWIPGEPFTAQCRIRGCHEAPRSDCTCGVYAAKTLDHLRRIGYTQDRFQGEVWLWGTVVEHEGGWRAQFAYPKTFFVPLSAVPFGIDSVECWLASLATYGCDIFLVGETGTVPLWRMGSGIDTDGIDLIVQRCSTWYARRAEQRRIKKGDRLAVFGHGIAVVEHADANQVQAVLGKTRVLRIGCEEVVWDEHNMRWETKSGTSIRLTGCKPPYDVRMRFS